MEKRILDSITQIIDRLRLKSLTDASAFLGFDACIDSIVRIVHDKTRDSGKKYFVTSTEFGEFLIKQENKSCGVELDTKLTKIGGNMVITGNALGNLGIKVDCVGTFGFPEILPVFRSMSGNCRLSTIAETINATALEFNESKVIVFDPGPYNSLSWNEIKDRVGLERLRTMVIDKQLISFLNWSEIVNSSEIWKGFLDEVFISLNVPGRACNFFTDLSDCSRKSRKEILEALDLLNRFRDQFKVTLSLNQNEAELVSRALEIPPDLNEDELVKALHKGCNVDILVIHRVHDAVAFNGSALEACETFFCSEPTVLTGGGDNFNAGFCFALLHNFDIIKSLIVANAVSGAYVKEGVSPSVADLVDFLQQNS